METLAVALGGACPLVSCSHSHPSSSSSSSFCSPTARNVAGLSYGQSKTTLHRHLAAFQPPSRLFPCTKSPPYSPRNSRKARIFLPHLVASLEAEHSYIMIKPDGVQRELVGEIISRFEKKGLKLTGLTLFQCPQELAEAWEGVGVVASARKLIGATNPLQAEPGTIRGDLAVQTGRNVVHRSDSPENGKREIGKSAAYFGFIDGFVNRACRPSSLS